MSAIWVVLTDQSGEKRPVKPPPMLINRDLRGYMAGHDSLWLSATLKLEGGARMLAALTCAQLELRLYGS